MKRKIFFIFFILYLFFFFNFIFAQSDINNLNNINNFSIKDFFKKISKDVNFLEKIKQTDIYYKLETFWSSFLKPPLNNLIEKTKNAIFNKTEINNINLKKR